MCRIREEVSYPQIMQITGVSTRSGSDGVRIQRDPVAIAAGSDFIGVISSATTSPP